MDRFPPMPWEKEELPYTYCVACREPLYRDDGALRTDDGEIICLKLKCVLQVVDLEEIRVGED
jgi:hypothetical protein